MTQDLADFIPALKFNKAKLALKDLQGAGQITFGDVYFVHSVTGSDTANAGKRPNDALATIDAAINKCTADNGDIIYVLQGHDENPTASIAMDVAGVQVIGLGIGSKRPTITFGAEAATVAMSAAGCRISNLRFDLGTVAATVTNAINITADGCQVDNCETVVHATSQFTNHLTATDAQFVKILNNKFHSLGAAGSTSGVVVDGCDDLEIIGNSIHGHFGEHALDNTTPGSCDEILRANICNNYITNVSATAGDMAVELDAAATGMFADNMVVGGLATTDANYEIGDMAAMGSYAADTAGVDVWGILLGRDAAV
jgi:hypothetical protein